MLAHFLPWVSWEIEEHNSKGSESLTPRPAVDFGAFLELLQFQPFIPRLQGSSQLGQRGSNFYVAPLLSEKRDGVFPFLGILPSGYFGEPILSLRLTDSIHSMFQPVLVVFLDSPVTF